MNETIQDNVIAATHLMKSTLYWLLDNYRGFHFWVERDLVWTVQQHLFRRIKDEGLPFSVFNEYPLLPGPKRSISADLAILPAPIIAPKLSVTGKWGESMPALVVVEFKYEPAHSRSETDIWPTKFPIVDWNEGVNKDILRIQEFVATGRTQAAFALFFDEGRHFKHRPALSPGLWKTLKDGGAIHWTELGTSKADVS